MIDHSSYLKLFGGNQLGSYVSGIFCIAKNADGDSKQARYAKKSSKLTEKKEEEEEGDK